MIDYFERMTYEVGKLWLTHGQSRFSGRGVLNCDPSSGFKLEAFLEGPRRKTPMTFDGGKFGLIQEADRRLIRMSLGGESRAVAPYVYVNAPDLHAGRLSIDLQRVFFFDKIHHRMRQLHRSGDAIFRAEPKSILPEAVEWTERIGDHRIGRGSYAGGLLVDDGRCHIYGKKEPGEGHLSFHYNFGKFECESRYAWDWPEGAAYALAVLRGVTTPLLKRRAYLLGNSREEVRLGGEVKSLGVLSPFMERDRWDTQIFFRLADFFGRRGPESDICRNIFDQMAAAARQSNAQAREFLLATILEAALRNVFKIPFTPGKKLHDVNISHLLSRFANEHAAPVKWREPRKRAEAAYRRLRDRNAHPDWLLGEGGEMPIERVERSLDDMIFLSKFYGYMILRGHPGTSSTFLL